MSNEIEKYKVLDDHGLQTMLTKIFRIVEDNYIRRTEIAEALAQLNARVTALEQGGGGYVIPVADSISFLIPEDSTNLIFQVTNDALDVSFVSLYINEDGDAILEYDDTQPLTTQQQRIVDAISAYSFNINEDGELIVTID